VIRDEAFLAAGAAGEARFTDSRCWPITPNLIVNPQPDQSSFAIAGLCGLATL